MIYEEKSLEGVQITLKDGEGLFYFKLISIGPKILLENNHCPSNIPSKINGVFVVGDKKLLREELHKYVDMACNKVEEITNE